MQLGALTQDAQIPRGGRFDGMGFSWLSFPIHTKSNWRATVADSLDGEAKIAPDLRKSLFGMGLRHTEEREERVGIHRTPRPQLGGFAPVGNSTPVTDPWR